MRINAEIIAKLNPCKDRFDNFKKHYPLFDGNLPDFLELKNISYSDKVWVVTRLFNKEQNITWSRLCANSVSHLIKKKSKNDSEKTNSLSISVVWSAKRSSVYANTVESAKSNEDVINYSRWSASSAASAARLIGKSDSECFINEKEQENKNLNLMLTIETKG